MHNQTAVLLHLSLIPGIGPATLITVMKYLVYQLQLKQQILLEPELLAPEFADILTYGRQLPLDQLYEYSIRDFITTGISRALAQLLVDGLRDRKRYEQECLLLEKHQVRVVTIFDGDYPDNLKHISVPPILLYVRGGQLSGRRMVALVGSRLATNYAQRFIDEVVPPLITQGWTMVSGGALGADTMVHRAALQSTHNIAVIGSGLLAPYPRENSKLFETLCEQGGVMISTFPLLSPPERWNFPARNRIIAGLSDGCLVVQAAAKSGALITAQYALEYGRQVFALPGSVSEPLSAGCHALLKQGATLVQSAQDILDAIGPFTIVFPKQADSALEQLAERSYVKVSLKEQAYPVQMPQETQLKQTPVVSSDPLLACMSYDMSIDELCFKTGLDMRIIQNRLFELQLDGKVEQDFTGSWRAL